RWGQGDCVRAEELLAQFPQLAADPEAAVDVIENEQLLRKRRGEAPDLQEYVRRFPHLAELLHAEFTSDESPAAAVPARQAGRYQRLGEIARGGMGAVLRVRDPDFERTLAVKVMLPGLPVSLGQSSDSWKRRA